MIRSEACGAWRDLESRLRPYVARRAPSAAEVDDILQEIFVRLHRGLPDLRDDERFGGWVYRVAANVTVDFARARNRDRLVTVDQVPEPADDKDGADPAASLETDLAECVALFVSRLPSPYREAITLTELQGLTQKDAADVLGVSLSAMKSRVQRGRDKIRGMFDDCCRISVDCRGRVVECEARALEEVPEDCRAAAETWAGRGR